MTKTDAPVSDAARTVWPAAVIFDLDGTLIESLPDIQAAANAMLAAHGFDPLDAETVRSYVGKGSRNLVERALRRYGMEPTDADIDAGLAQFLAAHDKEPVGRGYVFEGVIGVLDELKAAGCRLAVCTNKLQGPTRQVLAGYGLDDYFEVVIGGDAASKRKPDPAHVRDVLERLAIGAADAVMVGDSENDIEAAQGADVATVLVSFGYCHVPLESLGANAIVERFADVTDAVRRIASR